MSNVYFFKTGNGVGIKETSDKSQQLLETIIRSENLQLEKKVPLKVHFGEKGNVTFIKPGNFEGIIDYLQNNEIETCFMETSVMYGGQRYKKELHLKTAQEHGFTRLPVIIADGEHGEKFTEIQINKQHFKSCKIAHDFSNYSQLLVISHFKGHMLAGFGGAIKQLGMGHASKGGKLAMHIGMKPKLLSNKCKKCHLCETRCNENAITIAEKSFIDQEKCVGCGACLAICPHKAITIFSLQRILKAFIGNPFKEKLVEYAYAAQKDKNNIYINFALNITAGCDCEPRKMKSLTEDVGVFISTDPVAIDKACYDQVKLKGKKFRGYDIFKYAEKIGLGSREYNLIEI